MTRVAAKLEHEICHRPHDPEVAWWYDNGHWYPEAQFRATPRKDPRDIPKNMIGNSTDVAAAGPQSPAYDVVIRNGLFFDGSGGKPTRADVAIDGGKVRTSASRLPATGRREIDASGCWVMPGMLDIHTHYDAEIEAMPGLDESVRHGVTTVVMGNCSLSTAVGEKKDILDLFCRVESLPRDVLSKWFGDELSWRERRAGITSIWTNCRSGPTSAASSGTRTFART